MYSLPPVKLVEWTKEMDTLTEECSGYQRADLNLEEQQDQAEDVWTL